MAQFSTSAQYPERLFANLQIPYRCLGSYRLLIATCVHGGDEEREGYRTQKVPHIYTARRLSTGTYSSLGELFSSLTSATLEMVCSELEYMNTNRANTTQLFLLRKKKNY